MDSEIAQLWGVDGLISTTGSGVHAADLGTGQGKPGGGGWRLVTKDAEEPGPDERARAPGRSRPAGDHGNGDRAGHRGRGKGSSEVGEAARPSLPQKRSGDCRAVEQALAGAAPVQLSAGLADSPEQTGGGKT